MPKNRPKNSFTTPNLGGKGVGKKMSIKPKIKGKSPRPSRNGK